LRAANALATGGRSPDLTLFLDIDPAAGLARKRGETEAIRTGQEDLAFHRRVRSGYYALMAAAGPGRWLLLDATLPPQRVAADAWSAVEPLLGA
jgi:dTMP kinase